REYRHRMEPSKKLQDLEPSAVLCWAKESRDRSRVVKVLSDLATIKTELPMMRRKRIRRGAHAERVQL
ncbi:MAG: hypothetical protein WAU91_14045, partial [Desulfatitalea sp.]